MLLLCCFHMVSSLATRLPSTPRSANYARAGIKTQVAVEICDQHSSIHSLRFNVIPCLFETSLDSNFRKQLAP